MHFLITAVLVTGVLLLASRVISNIERELIRPALRSVPVDDEIAD
jgi:hypothetical protein